MIWKRGYNNVKDNKDQAPVETKETDSAKPVRKHSKFRELLDSFVRTKKRKVVTVTVAALLVLAVLAAIPATRYGILGLVIKKQATISIVDSVSKKPISEATVSLAGQTVKTNNKGEAKLKSVSVGRYQLKVDKKYYQTTSQHFTVPILSDQAVAKLEIKATGRQVLVKVLNKIGDAPLEKATVTVSGTSAVTDKNGEASVVLPISTKPQTATVTHDGFNQSQISFTVDASDGQKSEAKLTPAGKIYFLSKRTGKINVVKSNLDGSDQQVIVEGTGREQDSQTVLLASRDWKYLAFRAQREGDKPKLYLINTSNDKLSLIDEGNAGFGLIGWSGDRFIYKVDRVTTNFYDHKKYALKSFSASAGKLTTIDETEGGGVAWDYASENIQHEYILDNLLVYIKTWNVSSNNKGKTATIISVKPNGENKQKLKEINATTALYFDAKLYAPQEIYYRITEGGPGVFYEYENGKVAPTNATDFDKFYNDPYFTFLISPSGQKTFWYEARDGKNTLFIGDKDAGAAREVAVLSNYVPYGWYGDEYILMSKEGSELYVAARDAKLSTDNLPLKITDYHRSYTYQGYGYGYGGQ